VTAGSGEVVIAGENAPLAVPDRHLVKSLDRQADPE
jgi:hypothetical protein